MYTTDLIWFDYVLDITQKFLEFNWFTKLIHDQQITTVESTDGLKTRRC